MPSKQIHELAQAPGLSVTDQMIVSTSQGQLTRRASLDDLPFRSTRTGAIVRRLRDKLDERVSVKDFGAVGDGVADDRAAFVAACTVGAGEVHVPPGTYRLGDTVTVPAGVTILGAGRDRTLIQSQGPRAFDFVRTTTGTLDWVRGGLARLTLAMAQGGVIVRGHEWFASELKFRGGAAGAWCIELENANECAITHTSAGYGGGIDDLAANGIRWYGTEDFATINFGDGLIQEVALKGAVPNWIGIRFEHLGTSRGLINNVLFNRVQINCPQSGLTPHPGSIGISLSKSRRITLLQVDIEVVEVGVEELGEFNTQVTPGIDTSTKLISYIGSHILNCPIPYRDSNGVQNGSAKLRLFLGNTELSPLRVGNSSDIPEGLPFRAGEGDTFLPQALWLPHPSFGTPAVQLRANDQGVLVIAQDYRHSDEATTRLYDGNVKNRRPRRGLIIDASANDVTVIRAPRGQNTSLNRRIEIGNTTSETESDGELQHIGILNPLLLAPRTSEPVQPRDGVLIHASAASAIPATEAWWGQGGYFRAIDATEAEWNAWVANPASDNRPKRWMPAWTRPGMQPTRERNLDFTVERRDLGLWHRVNSGSARTVTIPNGLLREDEPCGFLDVTRQGAGAVTFAVSGGAILRTPSGRNFIAKQFQTVRVMLWRNSSGTTEVFIAGIYPDADLTPTYASRFRDRNASYTLTTTHLGEVHRGNHGSVDVVCTIPYGLWPSTGEDVVEFTVTRADNNAKFVLRADTNMTLRLNASTPGVVPDPNAAGKLMYELAKFETRKVWIRRIDGSTGEIYIDGLR